MTNDCRSDSCKKASNRVDQWLREGFDVRHDKREAMQVLKNAFRLKCKVDVIRSRDMYTCTLEAEFNQYNEV